MGLAAACRIAFVEQEIDHRRDDAEARGPLDRIRRLVWHAGRGDAALGARDALLHRGLGGEEGAGDLLDREAGDDAQRQRDLLVGRKLGMAADEQQPQHVVAIMLVVEALGHRCLDVAEIGDHVLGRQRLQLALRRVSSSEALRPTKISQASGSRGGPFTGQVFSARSDASWNASSARSRSRK